MLALVLALASADPSVVAAPAEATPGGALPWRALAITDPFSGSMGLEAPVGPVYVGVGAFGRGARSRAVGLGGVVASKSTSAELGAIAWVQGRFLDLDAVELSWVTRARAWWIVTTQQLAGEEAESTNMSVSAALGALADARVVDGLALRVGVDVVDAALRNTSFASPTSQSDGDDLSVTIFAPYVGVVIDLF